MARVFLVHMMAFVKKRNSKSTKHTLNLQGKFEQDVDRLFRVWFTVWNDDEIWSECISNLKIAKLWAQCV